MRIFNLYSCWHQKIAIWKDDCSQLQKWRSVSIIVKMGKYAKKWKIIARKVMPLEASPGFWATARQAGAETLATLLGHQEETMTATYSKNSIQQKSNVPKLDCIFCNSLYTSNARILVFWKCAILNKNLPIKDGTIFYYVLLTR